jgi:hypothetical protein
LNVDALGYLCAYAVGALGLLFLAAALHDRREERARFARRIGRKTP